MYRRQRSTIIVLVAAAVGALFLFMAWQPDDKPAQQAGHMVIAGRGKPAVVVHPLTPPTAAVSRPPAGVVAALGVDQRATVRNVVSHDERYGVLCGEITPDGSAGGFKRFVYVGMAKAADIDDGSPEFEARVREVCKRHP